MNHTILDKDPAGAAHAAPAPQRANAPSVVVKIIALVLCCVTAAACGELRASGNADRPPTVTVAGSPVPVPPGIGDEPRNFMQIGFDPSASGVKLRPELLRDLVQVVLPEAARRQAIVVTSLVGSNAYNAGANLEQVDFRAALNSETVDPTTLTTAAFNDVVASLTRALAGPPSGGSDPLGFLRRLADTRAQIPPTAHLLGVYIGDGSQSTKGCDLGLSPVTPDSALKATEESCIAGLPIRLSGADVWLIGVGAAPAGGGMTAAQAVVAKDFLTDVVRSAGGTVSKATAHPIAGGG